MADTTHEQPFAASESITGMVDELFAACTPLRRGDILTHESIEAIVGVPRHTGHYQHCVRKLVRRMERDRRISMWVEMTVGYKLLTPAEQLDVMPRRQRRANRQLLRGLRTLECLEDKDLTPHLRRLRMARLQQAREERRAIRAHLKVREIAGRPMQALPRVRPEPVEARP